VLGDHIAQRGSLVAPDRLRFDFSHYQPVTPDELTKVEALANARILANEPVRAYETSKDEAERVGALRWLLSELQKAATEGSTDGLAVLRRAGLIESVRGRSGGYRLAQPPARIGLGSLLLELGEPLFDEPSYCEPEWLLPRRFHQTPPEMCGDNSRGPRPLVERSRLRRDSASIRPCAPPSLLHPVP